MTIIKEILENIEPKNIARITILPGGKEYVFNRKRVIIPRADKPYSFVTRILIDTDQEIVGLEIVDTNEVKVRGYLLEIFYVPIVCYIPVEYISSVSLFKSEAQINKLVDNLREGLI